MKTPDVATEHPKQHSRERPADQAWFWTPEWQAKEAEVDAALARGEITTSETVEEFQAHLVELDRQATARGDAEGPWGGEGPLLLCQRYAAGDISRSDLVEALVAHPYPMVKRDPYDDFSPDPPGAWTEVEDAAQRGLIDDGLYEEVFHRRHPVEPNRVLSRLFTI